VAGYRPGTAPRDAIGWLVIVAVMGGHGQGIDASWRLRRVTVGECQRLLAVSVSLAGSLRRLALRDAPGGSAPSSRHSPALAWTPRCGGRAGSE
jgi:hypothetical protein